MSLALRRLVVFLAGLRGPLTLRTFQGKLGLASFCSRGFAKHRRKAAACSCSSQEVSVGRAPHTPFLSGTGAGDKCKHTSPHGALPLPCPLQAQAASSTAAKLCSGCREKSCRGVLSNRYGFSQSFRAGFSKACWLFLLFCHHGRQ